MDVVTLALLGLVVGIFSLIAHTALFPWVWHQRRVGAEKTKALVAEGIAQTEATVRKLLQDPEIIKGFTPKLDSLTASEMGTRRWEVAAAKKAKMETTRASILTWLLGQFGEVWGGMAMKFLEGQNLLSEPILLGNDWMATIGPVVKAFVGNKHSVTGSANEQVVVDPTNPYLRR